MPASFRSAIASSYYYGSTTLSLAKPAGAIEGDILIMKALVGDSLRSLDTLPSGWAIVSDSEQASPISTEMWVAWKKLGASEPASYDFIFNYAFNGVANITCWKDGDTLHKIASAAVSSVQTGPYDAESPTITTTINDCLLVTIHGGRRTNTGVAPTYTPPSGYTSRYEALGTYDWGMLAVCDKALATAGASGTAEGTFTVSGGGDGRTTAVHLAISPAVSSYTARPDGDVSAGTWSPSSGSDLYAMLDEETPSDADYIEATSAGTCEVALSSINAPPSGWITTIRYRILGDCTVSLRQGSTEIASWAHSPGPGSATTYNQSLSSGEQASISDWTDLRLRFVKP